MKLEQIKPIRLTDVEACVDQIIERVGKEITLGLPLGLGKPVQFANALYRRAKADPSIQLRIVTAISLQLPKGKSHLEKAFLGPFVEREFAGVPDLEYAVDAQNNALPENVSLSEFFFKAGTSIGNHAQQQNYISTNYTHAARDLLANGVNVVGQMVAPGENPDYVSLSCNPDLSIDLLHMNKREHRFIVVGELNPQLPYMPRDAEVSVENIDFLLNNEGTNHTLFPAPPLPINPADHLVGFYASALVKDAGTLQVGIGSLGSALTNSLIARHQHNAEYLKICEQLEVQKRFPVVNEYGGTGTFDTGLYGCSEMLVDGFMHLYKADVLKRKVYNDLELQQLLNCGAVDPEVSIATLDQLAAAGVIENPLRAKDVKRLVELGVFTEQVSWQGGTVRLLGEELGTDLTDSRFRDLVVKGGLGSAFSNAIVAHGGFYLGPSDFYQALRDLSMEEREKFVMTSVGYINHLYNHPLGDQVLKTSQRQHARFINSAMMVTINGAAISDGLEDGRVVSGVGGQYNFVAMAHELSDARSILQLRATRTSAGKTLSNIVFNYGHTTIPRHLRDIVVTEYGIADLRSKSDFEVCTAMLNICDSRFQQGLLQKLQATGKVPSTYQIPEEFRSNTPEKVRQIVQLDKPGSIFSSFPFGSAFTDEELRLAGALRRLKADMSSPKTKYRALLQAGFNKVDPLPYQAYLKRMDLSEPRNFKERLERQLLLHALAD